MGCNTSSEAKEEIKNDTEKNNRDEETKKEKSVEDAATKIQAAFRGHKARASMKQAQNKTPEQPSKEQLEAEFRSDDKELNSAACKIQGNFRGKQAAKKQAETVAKQKAEIAEIDLKDPDLNKAATKIQASFRGHKVRKDVVETK